jgi:hypothetical protein
VLNLEIDFHHGVIYVLSRLAGFKKEDSDIIASSSQFVDDAIWDHPVFFKAGEIYKPMSSAHKTLDYRNFVELANRLSWVSYHFLPGNCGEEAGAEKGYDFESRLICRPNSYIAKDMIKECINSSGNKKALFRLGISLHVYADTWSHQGFSGIQSYLNTVGYIEDENSSVNLKQKVKNFFSDIFDNAVGGFVENILPLGHGPVLSFPDKPYLRWKYVNSKGEIVERDNTVIFMEAVKKIYEVLCNFRNVYYNILSSNTFISDDNLKKIEYLLKNINFSDSIEREKVWLNEIENNYFGFGSEKVQYVIQGADSWEFKAFGRQLTADNFRHDFSESILQSNWILFHEALIDHHYYLTRVLFPKYKLYIS